MKLINEISLQSQLMEVTASIADIAALQWSGMLGRVLNMLGRHILEKYWLIIY